MSRCGAFDRILAGLHEAAFDDARWPDVARLVDGALGTKGNLLTFSNGRSPDDADIFFVRFVYRGERHLALEREYFEAYYPRDERVPRLMRLPDSELIRVSDLYTEAEVKSSAAYNEVVPRGEVQYGLNVRLDGPHGSRILWTLCDPTGADGWSFEQTALIERLLPHLRQYIRVRQALADVGGLGRSLATLVYNSDTGIIQLDRRGRIVMANDRARTIFKGSDGLVDRGGFLHARVSVDNDRLQRVLARALPGSGRQVASGSTVVRRLSMSHLVLHVVPVGHRDCDVSPLQVAALVLVVDPERRIRIDPGLVAEALRLSQAESRVAVLLAEGHTVGEVASASGRSENTVRWHIRRIYDKHGLTRLVQLVQLVRSLAAPAATMF